jgi:hypothetical protein
MNLVTISLSVTRFRFCRCGGERTEVRGPTVTRARLTLTLPLSLEKGEVAPLVWPTSFIRAPNCPSTEINRSEDR